MCVNCTRFVYYMYILTYIVVQFLYCRFCLQECYNIENSLVYSFHAKPLARSKVKIMKEFVWINLKKNLNLVFGQVGEKY